MGHWRYAVRRFAEAHVKRRLDELAASYSQLACTASSDGERSWLDRATNDCESVAERLTRWRAPLALAFAPLIVGALAKTVGSVSLYDPGMLVFGPLVIGIAYALVHVGGWFEEKRRLFRECGVYRLENDLFDKLDRGKSPEPPLDYAFSGLAVVVALVGIGILIVDIYRFSTRTFVLVVLAAAMIASVAAQWALRHRAQESVD